LNDFRYVDDDVTLARVMRGLRHNGVVGVDTEFIRTRTFFPIPALYQLAAGDDIVLIDPTRISSWQPFAEVLIDPGVTVIMHSCSEDLEVFASHLGVNPTAVFDTQIANAFVSERFSASYSNLVNDYLGVGLEKHETRSDWLLRPLSSEQLAYAAADVVYLEPLYRTLRSQLERLGRWAWFSTECAANTLIRTTAPELYFRGIRRAAFLSARQLARLKLLTAWREQQVRERDVPRARFVADDVLVDIAQTHALDHEGLLQLLRRAIAERRAGRSVQSQADQILALVARADQLAEHDLPLPEPPLTKAESAVVRELRDVAVARANELGLAPELLSRKRDLEACVRHYALHGALSEAFRGWRHSLVGVPFEAALSATMQRTQQAT
jgi:ribonuclease D